jgi:ferritin-like metal-binding protein YciE
MPLPNTVNNAKETLLDWLRDAHAMEDSIVGVLEKQVDQLQDKPELQGKVREHLEVTREHRERVKALIQKLGGDVSAIKKMTGNLIANLQAMTISAAPDSLVKSFITDYAVEHFEIASYTALVGAAEAQGQMEIARACRGILEQEREMANWLEHHLPRVTSEYLAKERATTTR